VVKLNMGFEETNSGVQLGIPSGTTYTYTGSYTSAYSKWNLYANTFSIDGTAWGSFVAGNAILDSTFTKIGVPQALFT
jgi:hypothetical protein